MAFRVSNVHGSPATGLMFAMMNAIRDGSLPGSSGVMSSRLLLVVIGAFPRSQSTWMSCRSLSVAPSLSAWGDAPVGASSLSEGGEMSSLQ